MRTAVAVAVALTFCSPLANAKLATMASLARQDPAAPPRIGPFVLSRRGDADDFDTSPEGVRGFCNNWGFEPASRPARVIEVMSFLRETHLLATKLRELHDIVDTFVVVEGTTTFSGEPVRPWLREGLLAELGPWLGSKVIALTQDELPSCADIAPRLANITRVKLPPVSEGLGAWRCGWAQETERRRIGLAHVLDRLDLGDDDVVVLSDVDEVMSRTSARVLKYCSASRTGTRPDVMVPLISLHYYGLAFHDPGMWAVVKTVRGWRLKEVGAAQASLARFELRAAFGEWPKAAAMVVASGGWHMSFFQSEKAMRRKLVLQPHHELRHPRLLDPERIRACQESGGDVYGRPDNNFMPAEDAADANPYVSRDDYLREYGPQAQPRLFREYPSVFHSRRLWTAGARRVPRGAEAAALRARCLIPERGLDS
ncbi:hypothetical protein FNF29_08275 [Cafeteria roenbergensis]|uniref:Glycosyl transferase 64 domain-containing protein n=1 Tax=Cafeteria roenbergensis TaxID=33653 RepID=A0A5A8BZT0_CAFRO|nr:hypothetical protein FNF29_08275 [Cafeteria roenbergensis]|eukprot:KAA0146064.1 hypothetical protein FNF29_08275 [Cafeteria roenbergensis]